MLAAEGVVRSDDQVHGIDPMDLSYPIHVSHAFISCTPGIQKCHTPRAAVWPAWDAWPSRPHMNIRLGLEADGKQKLKQKKKSAYTCIYVYIEEGLTV